MSAIRRHPVQSTLLTLLGLVVGLVLVLKYVARAQNDAGPMWSDADIGTASAPGNVQGDGNGGYAVSSSGFGIAGTNDAFNYVYQSLGTNGEIVAEVSAMQGGGNFSKAGLMIRETLDAGARNVALALTPGNGILFQWRSSTSGVTDTTTVSTNTFFPCWVKVARNGNWIGGYASADGTNWSLMNWQTISNLADQVYVGMAVSAGNTQGIAAAAHFEQVNTGPADPSQVLSPVEGSGDGLLGTYYPNRHLFGPAAMTRIDGPINFNWQPLIDLEHLVDTGKTNATCFASACKSLMGMPRCDQFSIRWTGEIQGQFTEPYTIYVRNDDGVRVWLDGQLMIDDWNCHQPREVSANTQMVAGQKHLLRIEYFQNHRNASVKVSWSSPSTPKRLIPRSQFYSQPTMDSNGLPIFWEEHYFGQTNVDPNADPDNDGLSNLQEYEQNSDPTQPLKWGLPNEWTHGDVEYYDGNSRGDASYSNGVFTVASSGHDIWDHHDDFQYAFQSIGTNGEIVARILGVSGNCTHAKAGLMLRESLDDNARNLLLTMSWTNALNCDLRPRTDDVTGQAWGLAGRSFPMWMKIARNGDWVGAYASPDGTNWTLIDWETLSRLSPQVLVGLAVTARNPLGDTNPCVAQFDNAVVGPAPATDIMTMVTGTGNGLAGSYRNDSLLYLPSQIRHIDSQVDFDWPHQPPMNLNPDGYGVSWSGEVQAQFTEPYTFSVVSRREDWVRVWVNERLVINQWRTLHNDGDFKAPTINLTAGRHYLIRVEMYNNEGHGRAILRWSSPSTPERVIPMDQLYAQPQMDPDKSGLPEIWEKIYFGTTGVDPNADPDNDGLSNLQEYQYHTNPTNSDTDGDGLPDAWEISHGLDPQYFDDGGMDYDNSGLSNLQDYLLGLNPLNADQNGDGLPDWFEEEYLGTGNSLVCTNQISVALSVNGAQATNLLGNWQVDGTDIYCLGRRGGADFNLPISTPDKYVLNFIGTQNQTNPMSTSFKLLMGIDHQTLGHYVLNAGYGSNGTVELVLPYLQGGTHTLHVFWDGVASFSSLRIKQVNLLSVSGATNEAGIKNWAAQMIADESGLDNTNPVISSYTSPMCLEGRDQFPSMMAITNNQTNALAPVATSDNRWYVNAPLLAYTQTVFQASYQNGALNQTANLKWLPVNLLAMTNELTIREGDSLLFNAQPASGANGHVQVVVGTNTYSSTTVRPVPCQFLTPGIQTVTGMYTAQSGAQQIGSVNVDVVQRRQLPLVQPDAWVDMERPLSLTNFPPEAALQTDSRLTCFVSSRDTNGGIRLILGVDANEQRTMIARLGNNGPVLDSTQVQGFDVWSGDQAYTRIIQIYPDGSQLVEMLVISSPVETNVTFEIQAIVSGVMFEDGTTTKTLRATNFDALGQCPVRFIRPASATTSVCNSVRAYQGNNQIGYRH
ncbi:MAG TPA: PA14 domain-containing protein [Verrucomicrobiae bacterium]|jgi:hypothetical protein|nr:PA14 domain-containing protein [Verrucomicrobiae bacterium]